MNVAGLKVQKTLCVRIEMLDINKLILEWKNSQVMVSRYFLNDDESKVDSLSGKFILVMEKENTLREMRKPPHRERESNPVFHNFTMTKLIKYNLSSIDFLIRIYSMRLLISFVCNYSTAIIAID